MLTRLLPCLLQAEGKDAIKRSFAFADFNAAFAFMTRSALLAEKVGGQAAAAAEGGRSEQAPLTAQCPLPLLS